MINDLLKFFLGSRNNRVIKTLKNRVSYINDLESTVSKLSDEQLRQKTNEFRQRLKNGETIESLLNEAFAVVREASQRTLGMRQFDVQLIGGIVLHEGKIAEMRTGEGKTLVAAAPLYLNALVGKGAHLVTVNNYLAERDSSGMSRLYNFLDLSVGLIAPKVSDEDKRIAYAADITYGTNNEFGFDYLRDNMRFRRDELVQREFHYAIVDEVDSILIDEARTPLIISGQGEGSSDLYVKIDKIIKQLSTTDYEKDEKQKNIVLTEAGVEKVEKMLTASKLIEDGALYDLKNMSLVHYVNQSIKANYMFKKEVDYIVRNNKVLIIDEFTGRIMDGRRYSDGIHQAIEAKENVTVQMENQTLASITFQNFFRMYKKLAGMTGTALTEAAEFSEIYNLDTIAIPTNVPVCRTDENDEIYRTSQEKLRAIVKNIKECHARSQPVLVGTSSVEKSEELDQLLKKEGLPHSVLNAKFHEYEAQIIAEAGAPRAITIATNMAGRGTDIKLGGNLETRLKIIDEIEDIETRLTKKKEIEDLFKKDSETVLAAGGLYIIGTERHESRRIDNQLRGRAGRQGDPGHSKFYLSLQDDLMRIFGGERLDVMLQKLGLKEDESIVHPWINKAVEKAQCKVEARNFDIRKHLLKFDDVMSEQRKIIYQQRVDLMSNDYDISSDINDSCKTVSNTLLDKYYVDEKMELSQDLVSQIKKESLAKFNVALEIDEKSTRDDIEDQIFEKFNRNFNAKKEEYGLEYVEQVAKVTSLKILDQKWKEHLLDLDRLRQGVNLRAYAQKDPLNEYKIDAFSAFAKMVHDIKEELVSMICKIEMKTRPEEDLFDLLGIMDLKWPNIKYIAPDENATGTSTNLDANALLNNELCPCKSGKKFVNCHGHKTGYR